MPIGTANGCSALIIFGQVQTANEARNERERLREYVHALVLPVGWVWWLLQPGQVAIWRISMNLHASRAVQEPGIEGISRYPWVLYAGPFE